MDGSVIGTGNAIVEWNLERHVGAVSSDPIRLDIVPGHPHVPRAPEKSPAWTSLRKSYEALAPTTSSAPRRTAARRFDASWVSVIGHLTQVGPAPAAAVRSTRTGTSSARCRTASA